MLEFRRNRAALSVIVAFAMVPLWRSADSNAGVIVRLVVLAVVAFAVFEAIARVRRRAGSN